MGGFKNEAQPFAIESKLEVLGPSRLFRRRFLEKLELPHLRWKDYRDKGATRHKTMMLKPEEFTRRFLLHVLPCGKARTGQVSGALIVALAAHDVAREFGH
jgi:hypothetical protein